MSTNFSVPIAKDSISWSPSFSQEVPVPRILKTSDLSDKSISIKNLLLPNSKLPFFIPLIKQTPTFYNSNQVNTTIIGNTPSPNLLDYFVVVRATNPASPSFVIYINFSNNYGLTVPTGAVTNQTTWSQTYYHCYDFVSDFLLLVQNQTVTSDGVTNYLNFTYIQDTTDLQISTTFSPKDYTIEFSQNLINLIPFRRKVINTGSEPTYQIIFNAPVNNTFISTIKIDPTRINPFKAIYLCSNNSEVNTISFSSNNYNGTFSLGNNTPPRTALFVFKYWDRSVRFDSPFLYSTDQPLSNCVNFITNRFSGDTLKLSVFVQSQDSTTFYNYIFDQNETVDFLLLTFLNGFN